MATETIKCNRGDWSGREITVDVDREAGTFQLFGYDFQLVKKDWQTEDPELLELLNDCWDIVGNSWPGPLGQVMAEVNRYTGKVRYLAFQNYESVYSRDADCPFKAAIQLLCNII